jgi:hypothetical protein
MQEAVEEPQKISVSSIQVIVMQNKTIRTALMACAAAGLLASTSANAQSYGGAPECGLRENYSAASQSCVPNYSSGGHYIRRSNARNTHVKHTGVVSHKQVRVARASADHKQQ